MAPSNEAADAAADTVLNAVEKVGLKEKMIVRFYSRGTEEDIVFQHAKSDFIKLKPTRDILDLIAEGDTTLCGL